MGRPEVDSFAGSAQNGGMRTLAILAFLICGVLAACSGDPKSLGITGPGIHTVPPPDADPGNGIPTGSPVAGTSYGGDSYGPTRGQTGFWGYNQ
jgi:hypothetical protein